jgi:hypothetical protein
MESSKHTPGPWQEYNRDGSRMFKTWRINSPSGMVAALADIPGEVIPNARLIAAAPDLLEALKLVRDNAKEDSPEMWDKVNAAIAKATG